MLLKFKDEEDIFEENTMIAYKHFENAEDPAVQLKDIKGILLNGLAKQRELNNELQNIIYETEKYKKHRNDISINVNHKLSSSLNGIVGFSNLIGDKDIPEEDRKEGVKIINTCTMQFLRVLENTLEIAKVNSGDLKINYVDVELNEFLASILASFESLKRIRGKDNIRIIMKTPGVSSCKMVTDPYRLRQILDILLDNALKFSAKGEICFGYEITGPDISFFVSDEGIGITKNMLDMISDEFINSLPEYYTKYGGSGLGLALCKGLVSLMKGKMSVDSKVGEGTTFRFVLPSHPKTNQIVA